MSPVCPALTNKGVISSDAIILEENGELISDDSRLVENFNDHYINIVESTMGAHPVALGNPSDPNLDSETVKAILDRSCDNPIISKIRSNKNDTTTELFSLPHATEEEINFIMKKLTPLSPVVPTKFHQRL